MRQAGSRAQPTAQAYERRIVERTRLLKTLDGTEARTVMLVAPAGYGKTTLARQWLDRAGGAWLGITAASCDVPVLARDLGAAIAEIAPIDLRRIETALSAARTPIEQSRAVARMILGQVVKPVEGWVVVDDYQLLTASPPGEELIGTLERSGRFRLMITSRDRPSWATSRRRVYFEIMEIGAPDLALDDEEVAELLPLNRRTAALREQARGWPAVIALAAFSEAADVPLSPDSLSATLYDYLAEELFERASPRVQRMLTTVAMLPPLEPSELAEFCGQKDATERVLSTGLAQASNGRVEVHPLAMSFLFEKVRIREDSDELISGGIKLALSLGLWNVAFDLMKEFERHEGLEVLIASSFASLIETGRIATLDMFGRYAMSCGAVTNELLDLIAAEVALRDGLFERALDLGESAARSLPERNHLKARGLIVAGRAAQLMHRYEDAFDLHTRASMVATRRRDIADSTWGRCLSALRLEHDRMRNAVEELEVLPAPTPEDRLRILFARQHLGFLTSGVHGIQDEGIEGNRLLSVTSDPWVRTGWGNAYGYSLALQGQYEDARVVLRSTIDDVNDSGLAFARPHVETSLAVAELGLRHFARCESLLRRVERYLDSSPDLHLVLNTCALRARLELAQQRTERALELTQDDFDAFPNRAIYGEYLGTRALALAVSGARAETLANASRAEELTGAIETHLLCAAARAVLALDRRDSQEAVEVFLDAAQRFNVWDSVVCAVRAAPPLAQRLVDVSAYKAQLAALFLRSRDARIAKAAGLGERAVGASGVLTAKEREVVDLLATGLRNKEIAAALFISSVTVKAHVRNIMRKLDARTRAEVVARYAEMDRTDTGTSGSS